MADIEMTVGAVLQTIQTIRRIVRNVMVLKPMATRLKNRVEQFEGGLKRILQDPERYWHLRGHVAEFRELTQDVERFLLRLREKVPVRRLPFQKPLVEVCQDLQNRLDRCQDNFQFQFVSDMHERVFQRQDSFDEDLQTMTSLYLEQKDVIITDGSCDGDDSVNTEIPSSKIRLGEVIGGGTYGIVYHATRNDKESVAAKKNRFEEQDLIEEVRQQMSFNSCKYIAQMFGYSRVRGDTYAIMEYADCGSLAALFELATGQNGEIKVGFENETTHLEDEEKAQERRASISTSVAIMWLHEIALGIEHLHSRNVMHRDIKPSNVLLDKNLTPKLSDFGSARSIVGLSTRTQSGGVAGSIYYMAPELVQALQAGRAPRYTFTADNYSFGVLISELCHRTYGGYTIGNPPPHKPLPKEFGTKLTSVKDQCLSAQGRDRYGIGSNDGRLVSIEIESILKGVANMNHEETPRESVVFRELCETVLLSRSSGALPTTAKRERWSTFGSIKMMGQRRKVFVICLLLIVVVVIAVVVPLSSSSGGGSTSSDRMETDTPTTATNNDAPVATESPTPAIPPEPSTMPVNLPTRSPMILPTVATVFPSASQPLINGAWLELGQDLNGKASGDRFGASVSLSADGSVLAVGASQFFESGPGYVSVYRYNTQSQSWTPMGQDIFGQTNGDDFGWSVSLNGNGTILAVGAIMNDLGGPASGHARVYEYNATSARWNQLGSDIIGQAAGDWFGYSVSLSQVGDVVAVGAPKTVTSNGIDAGSVRVLEYNRGTASWDPRGQAVNGRGIGNEFGFSVSMSSSGTIVAVGSPFDSSGGFRAGRVSVFQYNSSSSKWVPMGVAINGQVVNGFFGLAVSLDASGSVMAVGAPGVCCSFFGGRISVYAYDDTNEDWTQRGPIIVSDEEGDFFGARVSMSHDGNLVAVGIPRRDAEGLTDSGQVRIYQHDSIPMEWTPVGENLNGDAADDQFGDSVSLSAGGTLVGVGAYWSDRNGLVAAGYAKVFTLN